MNTTQTTPAPIKTRSVRYIARCKGCGETMSTLTHTIKGHSMPSDMGTMFLDTAGQSGCIGNYALACRKCGMARSAKPVKGTFNPEHICSSKCTASKGFVCDCSCGGKNHGASWGR